MKHQTSFSKFISHVGIFVSIVIAAHANAEIKNFAFSGVIEEVDDYNFLLDDSIAEGAEFSGFYIFNPNSENSSSSETVGRYFSDSSSYGLIVQMGNYVFRTNPKNVEFYIEVVDRPNQDNYLVHSSNNISNKPISVGHVRWQLDDPSGTALDSISLPLSPPDLQDWQSWFGLTVEGGSDSFFIRARINTIAEVPPTIPSIPNVSVRDATELRWLSELGYFYKIQKSENMETWTDLGDPILGDGSMLSVFLPRDSNKIFYRAVIANFEE